MESLQEWKNELRRVLAVGSQNEKRDAYDQAEERLKINLLLRRKAQIALLGNFRVIINEPDDGEPDQREERQQDKWIGQVGPKQNRYGRGEHDQHTAHRGSASLFFVLFRPFLANVLADLQLA